MNVILIEAVRTVSGQIVKGTSLAFDSKQDAIDFKSENDSDQITYEFPAYFIKG